MAIKFLPRQYSRFQVHHPVHYMTSDIVGSGYLLDLSLRGCRLLGDSQLMSGSILTLRVTIPDHAEALLIDAARVRWIHEHAAGIEFPHISAAQMRQLRKVVAGLVCYVQANDSRS